MAVNVYLETGEGAEGMPLDLQLDLLVDAELPEDARRELLRRMEAAGGGEWRELSMRFLQRQVERESVRKLMMGGAVVPAEMVETRAPEAYRFMVTRWVTKAGMMSVAAGVLIAATSAVVTLYVVKGPAGGTEGKQAMAMVKVPGETVGMRNEFVLNVPLERAGQAGGMGSRNAGLFPVENVERGGAGNGAVARRSVVIQPDGNGNAVVYPVNMMQMKVY